MITTSMSRMVVPFLALVAASGMALVFAIQHVGREPPADTRAATGVPAVSKLASGARDQAPAALGAAQAEANALTAELAGPPPAASGDGAPSFDIARVEPTGDAVIAGGRRRAQRWNCYGTASYMIARSRIHRENLRWSRPGFLRALTT
jgi:hypothetical protein